VNRKKQRSYDGLKFRVLLLLPVPRGTCLIFYFVEDL
jgi:hypothetical protein